MSELKLLIGLPASGKTTYAETLVAQGWTRINWDEMRIARGMTGKRFSRAEEDAMQKASFEIAEAAGAAGASVVVDNTNLNENTRNRWKGVAQRAKMTYTEENLGVSLEECIKRDSERKEGLQVGRAVIERMALFAGLIKFKARDRIVLVDMDGTLADCSHRRKFISDNNHDWDKFEGPLILTDEPREPIVELVRLLNAGEGDIGDCGFEIVIVSGRQLGRAGKNTVAWLKKHYIPFKYVFMRQSGDNRPDNLVKKDILDKIVEALPGGKSQIAYVLDDRNQVVEMWRDNGLTCLQVAPGDF
jgi:predicted kinase